ncbi:Methyltransferase domain-containing protein [Methylomagnum ishizawai]|uniref:Methyltransferase domain-containing protein n=1 Tax=Methylomagnum ishizawai TaxID=1760988 RepID=A0A1Y6D4D2_9GAMM|nr:class I SAM-dependent methyltransferase [Methylomagnum ishizawai]SMF97456.1 Methyltransferase domain-containing protein [Methylomagnum ishizawai]
MAPPFPVFRNTRLLAGEGNGPIDANLVTAAPKAIVSGLNRNGITWQSGAIPSAVQIGGSCSPSVEWPMSSSNTQHWNPAQYSKNARFVSDLGMPVVDWLDPRPGERILDLGCGDGALSRKLVDRGCEVVGVDASAAMIAAAQALGLDAQVVDGHSLPFENEFDAVFSNAALHWMTAPERVVSGVWRALKPGGRFVGEFGGHGNVAGIVAALGAALTARGLTVPDPWYFPRPEEYGKLLRSHGFEVTRLDLMPRPTLLPGDVGDWLATFAQAYTAALPVAERGDFIAGLVEALRGPLCDANGAWWADYVRLRFSATKPDAA